MLKTKYEIGKNAYKHSKDLFSHTSSTASRQSCLPYNEIDQ